MLSPWILLLSFARTAPRHLLPHEEDGHANGETNLWNINMRQVRIQKNPHRDDFSSGEVRRMCFEGWAHMWHRFICNLMLKYSHRVTLPANPGVFRQINSKPRGLLAGYWTFLSWMLQACWWAVREPTEEALARCGKVGAVCSAQADRASALGNAPVSAAFLARVWCRASCCWSASAASGWAGQCCT